MIYEILALADAWAASSAAAGEHAPSITQLFFPAVNFLIFVYLLKRYLMPFARNYFRSRREGILEAVQGAAAEKARAEETVRNYQAQLDHLDEGAKQIIESLRADGQREKAKLLAEAEELAGRIKADANFLADQEVKAARQQVRYEISRIAQEAAEKTLQLHVSSADQERLVGEILVQVREGR